MACIPCKDHLGNTFSSFSEMSRYYHLPRNTIQNRLLRGWTLEQALTVQNDNAKACKIKPKNGQYIYDHLGNQYMSISEMAEHYGITEKIYHGRRHGMKWSLEKTLTTPIITQAKNSQQVTDHTGVTWPSISEMARHWGIKQNTYRARIKQGWSVEQALTTPCKDIDMSSKQCKDHLGNIYPSRNAMCRAYNTSRYRVDSRLKLGWSLEDALTKQYVISSEKITDPFGNIFPSKRDAANYYCLPEYMLQGKKDISLRQLTKGLKKNKIITNDLMILKKLNSYSYVVSYKNQSIIMYLKEILKEYHNSELFNPLCNKNSVCNLEIQNCIQFPKYNVLYNNKPEIWTYWQIIQYNKDQNFGLKKET